MWAPGWTLSGAEGALGRVRPVAGQHFRAGVVAVVERSDGTVLAFERADARGQWQLPQGGLLAGEEPVAAAWRELGEETGLGPQHVVLQREHHEWVPYEWPRRLWVERGGDIRVGQIQRWFFFRPLVDAIVAVPDGEEFVDSRWVTTEWLTEQVWGFRRPAYERVLGGRP